jgi:hypothetical protein
MFQFAVSEVIRSTKPDEAECMLFVRFSVSWIVLANAETKHNDTI